MVNSHNISATISNIMTTTGLRTIEFCRVLSINKAQFCKMRQGKLKWDIDILKAISIQFRISLDVLILGREYRNLTKTIGGAYIDRHGKTFRKKGFKVTDKNISWLSFKTDIPKNTLKKILKDHFPYYNAYTKTYKNYIAIQKIKEALNTLHPTF